MDFTYTRYGILKSQKYKEEMREVRKYKNKESDDITLLDETYAEGDII